MNRIWGFLLTDHIAPVRIGEMGTSADKLGEVAWVTTLLGCMNGNAPGGVRLSNGEQPVSGDRSASGYLGDERPDGCLTQSGAVKSEQALFIQQLQFHSK
jgi:hypothetical protein